MSEKTKVNAAILIIGNEILSGRTCDTNTSTLALWLNSIGVKVLEVKIIPESAPATKVPFAYVIALRSLVIPEVLSVHVAPSEEVNIVPASPPVTNNPLP